MGMEGPSGNASPAERGEKSEAEIVVDSLREGGSLDLSSLYLEGLGNSADSLPMRPLTWNENAGIMVIADAEGRKFAIPATEQFRDALFKSGVERDETAGVPNLNEANMWNKDSAQREQNSGFRRWRDLATGARAAQDLETQAQQEQQRQARDEMSR